MTTDNRNVVELDADVVRELLLYPQKEMKRKSRWKKATWVMRIGAVIAVFGIVITLGGAGVGFNQGDKYKPHVAFVEVYGPIMSGQLADADRLIPSLHQAFNEPLSKAVVLRINSPGGSPVHAGRIYSEIEELRAEFPDKPVFAVIEDLGASAAYYIASATDKIYVDQASMVGSIGVITAGFGFTDVMKKIGVERRVITAGKNKAFLDPYLPKTEAIDIYWKDMLSEVHQQFITAVKKGRGDRLNAGYPDLFSGLVWSGTKSIEIGLTDDYGSLSSVSRDTLGEVNNVNYTPAPDFFKAIVDKTQASLSALMIQSQSPVIY